MHENSFIQWFESLDVQNFLQTSMIDQHISVPKPGQMHSQVYRLDSVPHGSPIDPSVHDNSPYARNVYWGCSKRWLEYLMKRKPTIETFDHHCLVPWSPILSFFRRSISFRNAEWIFSRPLFVRLCNFLRATYSREICLFVMANNPESMERNRWKIVQQRLFFYLPRGCIRERSMISIGLNGKPERNQSTFRWSTVGICRIPAIVRVFREDCEWRGERDPATDDRGWPTIATLVHVDQHWVVGIARKATWKDGSPLV